MARTDKAAVIDELAQRFEDSAAAVLTDYRGLTVSQMSQLRRSLGPDTTYAVVKNTLTRIAAARAGIDGLEDQFSGPSAVAFIGGDPVEAAKGLRSFAKENDALIIKAGYMDGKVLSAEEVSKLADLESRDVLLAKLAGAMKASMSSAASLFNAPLSQAARTVEALRAKAEEDPTILAGGAGEAVLSTPETSDAAAAADDATEAASAADDAPSSEASPETSEG